MSSIAYRIKVVETIEPIRKQFLFGGCPTIKDLLGKYGFCDVKPDTYLKWVYRHEDDLLNHESQRSRKRRVQFCNCPPKYIKLSAKGQLSLFKPIADALVESITCVENRFFYYNGREEKETRKRQNIYNEDPDDEPKKTKRKRKGKKALFIKRKFKEKDTKRYMTSISPEDKDGFYSLIVEALQPLMPNHRIMDLLLLESVEGVKRQQPHTDFTDFDSANRLECDYCFHKVQLNDDKGHIQYLNNSNMSYSFIIALYDNTPLYFFYKDPHDETKYVRKDRVVLSKYEGVIWEALTIHSGAEYDEYNARLFGKFVSKAVPDKDGYFSWESKDT